MSLGVESFFFFFLVRGARERTKLNELNYTHAFVFVPSFFFVLFVALGGGRFLYIYIYISLP